MFALCWIKLDYNLFTEHHLRNQYIYFKEAVLKIVKRFESIFKYTVEYVKTICFIYEF